MGRHNIYLPVRQWGDITWCLAYWRAKSTCLCPGHVWKEYKSFQMTDTLTNPVIIHVDFEFYSWSKYTHSPSWCCSQPNFKCREDHQSLATYTVARRKPKKLQACRDWNPYLCDPSKPTGAWSFNWFVIYRYLRGLGSNLGKPEFF